MDGLEGRLCLTLSEAPTVPAYPAILERRRTIWDGENEQRGTQAVGASEGNTMGTSDGISARDWDVVHELAVEVVNAPDKEKAEFKQKLLDHLRDLELRYGPLPSILATRSDYLDQDNPTRLELLMRAHDLAHRRSDTQNMIYVAQSLAELYLEKSDLAEADRWLSRMREHLVSSGDTDYAEYDRLRSEYRKFAIRATAIDTQGDIQ